MEEVGYFETLASVYQTAWRHNKNITIFMFTTFLRTKHTPQSTCMKNLLIQPSAAISEIGIQKQWISKWKRKIIRRKINIIGEIVKGEL
jgi:hypothetical protein